jgi:hypothetical protein
VPWSKHVLFSLGSKRIVIHSLERITHCKDSQYGMDDHKPHIVDNVLICFNHETYCGWLRNPAPIDSYERNHEGNYEGNYEPGLQWDFHGIKHRQYFGFSENRAPTPLDDIGLASCSL